MINSDSLEKSQDVSARSVPLSTEACTMISPESFENSDERKEDRSKESKHQVRR